MNFLTSPPSNRHEGCPHKNCCDSSETYIKSSSFRLQGFGKTAALFSVMPYWEGGRIVGSLNLENCSQILAHNVYCSFPLKYKISLYNHPPFHQRSPKEGYSCLQSKSCLTAFGMIAYIRAARMVTDHTDFFELVLLESFVRLLDI